MFDRNVLKNIWLFRIGTQTMTVSKIYYSVLQMHQIKNSCERNVIQNFIRMMILQQEKKKIHIYLLKKDYFTRVKVDYGIQVLYDLYDSQHNHRLRYIYSHLWNEMKSKLWLVCVTNVAECFLCLIFALWMRMLAYSINWITETIVDYNCYFCCCWCCI